MTREIATSPSAASSGTDPLPPAAIRFARARLDARIGQVLPHAALWITGPRGSGKTTLVAHYAAAHDLPCVTYAANDGQHTPEHVMRKLHQSLCAVFPEPIEAEERLAECLASARYAEYFALLREVVPRGTILVFEDVHRIAPAVARELITTAIGELRGALSVIVTACASPGVEWIQLIAKQRIAVIDWQSLRFTRDEIAGILPAQFSPFISEIADATEGWVTGVVLLTSAARDDQAGLLFDSPSVQERLSDYFANEVMAALAPDTRATASQLAPLADFSKAIATTWCLEPGTLEVVDGLVRDHCFIERDRDDRYRFHPLFRRFLLAQMRFDLGDDAWRAWMAEAARLLAANDGDRAAVRIYVEIGAWKEAVQALARLSTNLRRTGEGPVLLELARHIPEQELAAHPRLSYDTACAAMQRDRVPFAQRFEAAHAAYIAAGDAVGAALTAAAALRAVVSDFSNMRTIKRWMERLKDGLAAAPEYAQDDDALMFSAGVLAAANFESSPVAAPDEVARHAQAVLDAIMGDAAVRDVNVALLAAESLLEYYNHVGQRSHSEQVVLRCAAWLKDPRLSRFLCARWLFWVGNTFRFLDLKDQADRYFADARRIGTEHDFKWIEFHILRADLRACIDRTDYALAKGLLERMQSLLDFERPLDIGDYYYVKGWIELLEGDAAAALEDFRIARDAAERGCYAVAINFYRSMEAYALIALEDEPAAIAILEDLSYASTTPRYQSVQKGLIALAQAWRARREDEAHYRALLQQGFAAAKEHTLIQLFRPLPAVVARLASDALEYGIERDFVLRVISERNLPRPISAAHAWPWRIKLRTLGTFEILLDDQPIVSTGKAQKKLLDLLKILVALGGREVSADRLVDAMWPDPDDVGTRGALDVALTRLRKLLGVNEAIVVSEGKVSLNADLVWVDALALEQRLKRWLHDGDAAFAMPDVVLRPGVDKIFALYGGHFLNRDGDAPWLLPLRERLWSAMSRVIDRLGADLQRRNEWRQAAELYRRATELDLLTEAFYRNLMACYRELGRTAEAIDAYRRCRQNLSVILGIAPSAETEAVYRSLRAQAPS